ncbi:hypothetical protein [Bradyrhizobium sp. RDM4]|uniref:hypothetical protein n=1 Tax=Bradyrhizobium sp. RDM4 TaxID=3378765 RepID=UPI0038FBEF77
MRYLLNNGAMQTIAAPAKVATGTAIKTMLQFKPLVPCKIIEWGLSFDGSAAATPGEVELIETDVAATVTAFAAADCSKWDGEAIAFGDPTSALISVGAAASGFTASAEGTITAVRDFDIQLIAGTNQYLKQFPLGREPFCQPNKFTRVRVTFGASVNMYTYLLVEF